MYGLTAVGATGRVVYRQVLAPGVIPYPIGYRFHIDHH
jgi:hypothetical protein